MNPPTHENPYPNPLKPIPFGVGKGFCGYGYGSPWETQGLPVTITILVMEHEKVAVVTKHGDGGSEEVFACTDNITVDENTNIFTPTSWRISGTS